MGLKLKKNYLYLKMSFLNITDPEKRDFLVKEFLKSKQNIRLNSLSEKLGDIGLQRELTKLYKPITDSQTAQSATLTKELSATTTALNALPAVLKSSLTSQMIQFPSYPSIRAEEDKLGPNESLIELGPIATEYLRSMAGKTLTDKIFGLYDKNGAFYIGDSEVTLSGDDIIIGETEFTGTPGLWELITSKNPDSGIYNTDDLDNYETILLNTNAIVNPKPEGLNLVLAVNTETLLSQYMTRILDPEKNLQQQQEQEYR